METCDSLCMYISMETVVGASTGLSTFISVFSTMLYELRKIIVSIAQICCKLTNEKLNCKLFDIYIYIYIYTYI